MYKIAILGCENSHANNFLEYIYNSGKVNDVEVVGVYSDEEEPCRKLNEKYGVYVAKDYDEFVGKIDGLIVTARHGANHYKYAKPYIKSGIPMFIDKPITACEDEAVEFMKELKANNVRVSGGSLVVNEPYVKYLKDVIKGESLGNVVGGFIRTPINYNEQYGGFWFYTQHLVQTMGEIFGYYPDAVQMFKNGENYSSVVRYSDYDVLGEFVTGSPFYYASVSFLKGQIGDAIRLSPLCSNKEFEDFYSLLKGGEQTQSYKEFIAPVLIISAMVRSLESGKEEKITKIDEI